VRVVILDGLSSNLIYDGRAEPYKLSSAKTVGMHFCDKRGLHPDPELKLYNSPIKIIPETIFLGFIFDNQLAFLPHIKMLKNKCLIALNILKLETF
jgi:hypothetical protein